MNSPAPRELSPTTFAALSQYVRHLCGLSLTPDRAYLIQQRLGPLLNRQHLNSFEELAHRLPSLDTPSLRDAIIEAMTTHETAFFRDGHPFEALRHSLLPELRSRAVRRPVRLWCAGIASGQEPYSLAMTLLDWLDFERPTGVRAEDFFILATDISTRSLALASAGVFSERETRRGLSPAQVARHFHSCEGGWTISQRVRRLIEFRRLNLIDPWPEIGTFDGIMCRNVLIYFDESTRRRVAEEMAARLHPSSWLLIGAAESLFGICDSLRVQRLGETTIYRKPGAIADLLGI